MLKLLTYHQSVQCIDFFLSKSKYFGDEKDYRKIKGFEKGKRKKEKKRTSFRASQ